MGWNGWTHLALLRAQLDAGADPNSGTDLHGRPLHQAAERGSPEAVARSATIQSSVNSSTRPNTASTFLCTDLSTFDESVMTAMYRGQA